MIRAEQSDWARRFAFSCLFGAILVAVSTAFVLVLDSNNPTKAREAALYLFGVPLLPGWGFVSAFFGEWQAVHQGQIALIPPVSLVVDSGIIFLIWEYLHRKNLPKTDAHTTLGLNR